MPKKAKEKDIELNNEENTIVNVIEEKSKVAKKSASKASTKARTKKSAKDKVNAKSNKSTKSVKGASTTASSATATKSKTTKKSTARKSSTAAKTSSAKSSKNSKVTKHSVLATEYYDLPFRYNQTIVKILAQTPNTLFIYWDISDKDRQAYVDKYGAEFFNDTRPYLVITNETMHYTFEVEINDFANSWYLHINDANCEYRVELGRKFIVNSNHNEISSNLSSDNTNILTPYYVNDYLYITSSNKMDAPNDHILFDKLGSSVFFRNVKTSITEQKDISTLSFLQKIGKVYNIYDLYKEIYHDELISDEFELNLPSSSSSSSFR